MDKQTLKKFNSFIGFLNQTNTSSLPMSLDVIINDIVSLNGSKTWAEYSRYYFISLEGKIKEEYQEMLNEHGFAIELNNEKLYGTKPFFIRTEKGLLVF